MTKLTLIAVLVVCFFSSPAAAQLVELTEETSFSAERVRLDLSAYSEAVGASNVLAAWGVSFSSVGSASPRIGLWLDATPIPIPIPPFSVPVVQNRAASPAASMEAPLVIDFRTPARRVGLILHQGTDPVQAGRKESAGVEAGPLNIVISAYDSTGADLGQIQRQGLGESEPTLFLGVESANQTAISKLVLDYGSASNFEEVEAIVADFEPPQRFRSALAQIAAGPLPDGRSLLFSIAVTNIESSPASGTLVLRDSDGENLSLELDGVLSDAFNFVLEPYRSLHFTSSGNLPDAVRGYAVVESDRPVFVSEIFRVVDAAGAAEQETGLDATLPQTAAIAPVSRRVDSGLDAGVAVANLADRQTRISLGLSGPGGFFRETVRDLSPGEQIALFLEELFSDLPDQLDGALWISSTGDVAVTTLRTIRGIVTASVPSGSLQEGR